MKILYFTRGQSPHDLRFVNSLAATEHSVAILTLEPTDSSRWPSGAQVLSWPASDKKINNSSVLRLSRYFRKIVTDLQPDVIHAGPVQRVAYIAALAKTQPLLSMSWGSDLLLEAEQTLCWKWRTRFTLHRSRRLAADCQTVVKKARRFGYRGPVSIFPWGVDLAHFKPEGTKNLCKQLGWEDKIVFLCNRTMEPLYGVDVVAQAFALASRQDDRLRLFLFGKGSQETKIRAILREAESAGKVCYGGMAGLESLPDIYRSADIYISASHSDGSSVSLMEALACGTPALVSDIPSNKEWIQTGKQGWLFPDGDSTALAEQMLKISRPKIDLASLSSQARILAEEKADWKKNFAILLEAYRLVTENSMRVD